MNRTNGKGLGSSDSINSNNVNCTGNGNANFTSSSGKGPSLKGLKSNIANYKEQKGNLTTTEGPKIEGRLVKQQYNLNYFDNFY